MYCESILYHMLHFNYSSKKTTGGRTRSNSNFSFKNTPGWGERRIKTAIFLATIALLPHSPSIPTTFYEICTPLANRQTTIALIRTWGRARRPCRPHLPSLPPRFLPDFSPLLTRLSASGDAINLKPRELLSRSVGDTKSAAYIQGLGQGNSILGTENDLSKREILQLS